MDQVPLRAVLRVRMCVHTIAFLPTRTQDALYQTCGLLTPAAARNYTYGVCGQPHGAYGVCIPT